MVFDRKDASKLCWWSQQGAGESQPVENGKNTSSVLLQSFDVTLAVQRDAVTTLDSHPMIQKAGSEVHSFLMKCWMQCKTELWEQELKPG